MSSLQEYTKLTTARYERKFPIDDRSFQATDLLIKHHPKLFREIYHQRWINNIYFDTTQLDFFKDNQDGKKERKKVRIRWYGNLTGVIEKPILEIKIKDGLAGSKISMVLPPFEISDSLSLKEVANWIQKANLPDNILLLLDAIKPTLINRYRRKYYQDFSKKYRITLDDEMSYYNIRGNSGVIHSKVHHQEKMVIELKYSVDDDGEASNYSSYFPFRMNKHSKYVNGIEAFYSVTH